METQQLGHLSDLPGTWVGRGFNLISLPNGTQAGNGLFFRLLLSSTLETLSFSSLGGPIPNRGGQTVTGDPTTAVKDIFFKGLHYFQQVSDAKTLAGLHAEPGLWLNLPGGIARLGTVPHGDSLLAQGQGFVVNGGPKFDVADPTPFTNGEDGSRVPIRPDSAAAAGYLAPFSDASLRPEGISAEDVLNPNRLLAAAIADQHIKKTTVLQVDSTNDGGILNIPFVKQNADVTNVSSTFWIEEVINPDGTEFLQLQYTQTVILDFAVQPRSCPEKIIRWPHISVATLVKQ